MYIWVQCTNNEKKTPRSSVLSSKTSLYSSPLWVRKSGQLQHCTSLFTNPPRQVPSLPSSHYRSFHTRRWEKRVQCAFSWVLYCKIVYSIITKKTLPSRSPPNVMIDKSEMSPDFSLICNRIHQPSYIYSE